MFIDCKFIASNLSNVNFGDDDYNYNSLIGVIFSNCNLYQANFNNSTLNNVDFSNENLSKVKFFKVKLINCDFEKSHLMFSEFDGTYVNDCNFSKASIDGIKFKETKFINTTLKNSYFDHTKNEFFGKMLMLKDEIPAFRDKLIKGEVDGSCYSGECCCFIGTIANLKNVDYKSIKVKPNLESFTEIWFLGISEGDTLENSEICEITVGWVDEFLEQLENK